MSTAQRPHHIRSISVSRLFGRYSYSMPAEGQALSDVNIIYGQNGAGKTTLLALVFHLLSPSQSGGHRSAISEIPFADIEVILEDGTAVTATKDPQLLIGPVKFAIRWPDADSVEWMFYPGPRSHSVRPEDLPANIEIDKLPVEVREDVLQALRQRKFFEELGKLRVAAYMLTSDRILQGDKVQELQGSDNRADWKTRKRLSDMMLQYRTAAVSEALANASMWLQRKVLQGSYGRQSAAALYLDIVRKIAKTTYRTRTGLNKTQEERIITSLTNTINALVEKSSQLEKFGIFVPAVSPDILGSIQQSKGNRLHLINNILEPYLGGVRAAIENATPIYRLLNMFISSINGFLRDKKLSYTLSGGLKIVIDPDAPEPKELHPFQLSSGEQQLLLMFCHVLAARDTPSVFMIDEPELSLNILWQRMLVSALQDIATDANIQFVFASHSIEILTKHRDRVVALQEAKHG